MAHDPVLNFGLGSLPLLSGAQTRSISAENPDGSKGGGAKADPQGKGAAQRLGKGWKVRPCIPLKAGTTTTLADIRGPGVIQHIWMTAGTMALVPCVLRFYWDDQETPSVEVPYGDFFACGHGLLTQVNSLPVCVNPKGGMNCYWPMPFRKRCRITVENQGDRDITWAPGQSDGGDLFYQITYALTDVPAEAGYFHAQHRRSMTTRERPEHVILGGVTGQGHYVGAYLAWTQMSNGWWGEGEVKFYIDGDKEHPTYCGTGTEDYFGGAWCFHDEQGREQAYSTPFLGMSLVRQVANEVPRYGLYRWHVMDPIHFAQDLRVTIQALGWWPDGTYQPLTDDIASTAYWYQSLPTAPFPPLPDLASRYPR